MDKQHALAAKDSNILLHTIPITPFPLALVRLNLDDSVQFGPLQYKKNVDGLEQANGCWSRPREDVDVHPCRYPRLDWTQPWATYFNTNPARLPEVLSMLRGSVL